MSRIAKKPIVLPDGVSVAVDGTTVSVKGKLGNLSQEVPAEIGVSVDEKAVRVTHPPLSAKTKAEELREVRKLYSAKLGLTWKIITNMVDGVTNGFKKVLLLEGVGYRAAVEGTTLVLQVGYSNDRRLTIPDGIKVTAEQPKRGETPMIIVEGINKQVVGAFAALIRKQRPVEPYKGKGVRYEGEYVIRKEGKAASK